MVIKGQSVAGAKRLSDHLQRVDTNERMEVLELRGVAATDLEGGLREMEAVASGTRCQKPFYHASINTRADERLTDAQRMQAIDRLESELGLAGQPRMVVLHEKEGREHCHVVWSRIELERMRTISDSHNYRKHELVARELEREFGHQRVQGAHVERDGQPRPARTPGHDEMQQASRGGVTPKDARAQLTELWQRTDSGQAFRSALEERDWLLARGDRRDFVAIDPQGGIHSLARRIEGMRAADIRERMADIDAALLPSVAEARAQQQARQAGRQEQEAPTGPAPAPHPEPAKEASGEPAPSRPSDRPAAPEPAARSPYEPLEGLGQAASGAERAAGKGLFMAAEGVGRAAEKLTDFVAGLFDSGAAPPPSREYRAAELARDPAARRDHYAQQAAERVSDQALERIREDMAAGKGLGRADIQNLSHAHLVQIRGNGDDHLRQVVDELERVRGRSAGIERERDR